MLLKWHAAAILSYSKLLCNNTCLCLCSGSRALEPGDDKQRGLGWWMSAQKQFEHCFSLKHELSTAQRCEHNMSPTSNRKRSELSICHILSQQIALFCLNGYNFQQQYWNLKKNPTRTTSAAARLDLDWNACPPCAWIPAALSSSIKSGNHKCKDLGSWTQPEKKFEQFFLLQSEPSYVFVTIKQELFTIRKQILFLLVRLFGHLIASGNPKGPQQ